MSEHGRMARGGDPDPRDERLRSLLQAAYPAAEPTEALEEGVAALIARQGAQTARRGMWRPLPFRWAVAGALAASAAAVALTLALVRGNKGREPRMAARSVPVSPSPQRGGPGRRYSPRIPRRNREPQIAKRNRISPVSAVPPGLGRSTEADPTLKRGANVVPSLWDASGLARPEAPRGQDEGPGARLQPRTRDDLSVINQEPEAVIRQWAGVPSEEWERIEAQVRRTVRVRDDFVSIPFPRLAAASQRQIAQAVAGYKKEAAVVDARLSRQVSLQAKGMALSDLCEGLQEQSGIRLAAGRSVADDKVTAFCEKTPLREVMRQVNRLFGFTWLRSGKEGEYRYELQQDLRSQLLEEELRNRDLNAALVALDAEMGKYQPYLEMSLEEFLRSSRQAREGVDPQAGGDAERQAYVIRSSSWGGMQMYHRLTHADRAALAAGEELVFRPDAPNPDRRLPADLGRPILRSLQGKAEIEGRPTPIPEVPGIHLTQVRLKIHRPPSGEANLLVVVSVAWGEGGGEVQWSAVNPGLATGRSPSVGKPQNAKTNAALRRQSPFDQVVSLRPEPSCPATKNARRVGEYNGNYDRVFDLSEPHALSADVWEAVHRASGLPIIADFYTRLHPIREVTLSRQPLFEALCSVGDALGVRWRKEGDFLLCRSKSYFWERLQEVPNRYLERWKRDRDASGGLPVADFLEMATMTDQQLDSGSMAQGIEHLWGLREWAWLGAASLDSPERGYARLLTTLNRDQLRRALAPAGLPFRELTLVQQQIVMRLRSEGLERMERYGGLPPGMPRDDFAHAHVNAVFVPAGWCVAEVDPPSDEEQPWTGIRARIAVRTPEEATAAAQRILPGSTVRETRQLRDGVFIAEMRFYSR